VRCMHRGGRKEWDEERTKCEGGGEKEWSVRIGTIRNKNTEERRGEESV
jgi:hypothetical protein